MTEKPERKRGAFTKEMYLVVLQQNQWALLESVCPKFGSIYTRPEREGGAGCGWWWWWWLGLCVEQIACCWCCRIFGSPPFLAVVTFLTEQTSANELNHAGSLVWSSRSQHFLRPAGDLCLRGLSRDISFLWRSLCFTLCKECWRLLGDVQTCGSRYHPSEGKWNFSPENCPCTTALWTSAFWLVRKCWLHFSSTSTPLITLPEHTVAYKPGPKSTLYTHYTITQ